jgi:hypothetical protein
MILFVDRERPHHRMVSKSFLVHGDRQPKSKRTAATRDFDIGIAEGGARTLDLEVYLSLS